MKKILLKIKQMRKAIWASDLKKTEEQKTTSQNSTIPLINVFQKKNSSKSTEKKNRYQLQDKKNYRSTKP